MGEGRSRHRFHHYGSGVVEVRSDTDWRMTYRLMVEVELNDE